MRPNNKMFRVCSRIRQDVIIILFVNLRNYITLRKINDKCYFLSKMKLKRQKEDISI